MKNVFLIDRLQEYFLTQDAKVVCRALANCLVDFHRLATFEGLPQQEADSLIDRLGKNEEFLFKFYKDEPLSMATIVPLILPFGLIYDLLEGLCLP